MKRIVILTLILTAGVFAQIVDVQTNELVEQYGWFEGASDGGEVQQTAIIHGQINVTSDSSMTKSLADINVSLGNVDTLSISNASRDLYVVTNAADPSNLHIPELLAADTQSASYTPTGIEVLNFTVTYIGSSYKYQSDENITVNVTIGIPTAQVQLDDIICYFYNVTKDADAAGDDVYDGDAEYDPTNITAWPTCTYSDYPGAVASSSIKDTWIGEELKWEVGTMHTGQYNWTYFNLTAANTSATTVVNSTKILCSFSSNQSFSTSDKGLYYKELNATGSKLQFNVTKVLGGTWITNASVYNPNPFTLQILTLDIWATAEGSTDPGAAILTGSYYHNITLGNFSNAVPGILDPSHASMTYPDTTFSYSGTPVIWVNMSTDIDWGQLGYSNYVDGANLTYQYDLQVRSISGYYIFVQKNITNTTNNVYNISLLLKNQGSASTPSTVMMFDFVPQAFYRDNGSDAAAVSPRNMTVVYNDSAFTTAEDEGNAGDAWGHSQPADTHESQFTGNNSAPNYLGGGWSAYWKFATLATTEFAMVRYTIEGTSDYQLGQTFVVGVDPIQTTGMGVAANPMSFVEAASISNMEPLLAFLNFVLVVLVAISIQRRRRGGGKK